MTTFIREVLKRPLTICVVVAAVILGFCMYPAPIHWVGRNVSEWLLVRELNYRSHEMNAAKRLHNEGKLDEAAAKLNALLLRQLPKVRTWPYQGQIRQQLALVRMSQGRCEDALREINALITGQPTYLAFYLTRADIHFEMKQFHAMLEDCELDVDQVKAKTKANVKLERSDYEADYLARQEHAMAWARLGEFKNAEHEIRELIRSTPIDRYNYGLLAEVFARQKDYKQALKYFNQAYELNEPDWKDNSDVATWNEVANNLAELLAACPDASVRDGKRAKTIAEEVLAKTDTFPFANLSLAAAYAELGDFDKAVEVQSQMMSRPLLNINSPHQQARLESYQRKQPFRLTRYEEP